MIPKQRYSERRKLQKRDFEGCWVEIQRDFFSASATIHLRTCFRVSYGVFEVLYNELPKVNDFWIQKPNAAMNLGIVTGVKILVALKVLANGCSASAVHREFKMCISSVQSCIENFVKDVIDVFEEDQLSSHLTDPEKFKISMRRTQQKHGVPGLAGSIDCVHVYWHMCKYADQAYYKQRYKHPTLVSEAICDSDLRFTHLYAGQPGTYNDLNVLYSGTLVTNVLQQDKLPVYDFEVGGQAFHKPFFFGDGIYPKWPVFLTAPRHPATNGEKKFTKKQESVRKDFERAFGVVKCRFKILKHGLYYHSLWKCVQVIRCCFTLHNMILNTRLGQDPVDDLRMDNILLPDESFEEFMHLEEESSSSQDD